MMKMKKVLLALSAVALISSGLVASDTFAARGGRFRARTARVSRLNRHGSRGRRALSASRSVPRVKPVSSPNLKLVSSPEKIRQAGGSATRSSSLALEPIGEEEVEAPKTVIVKSKSNLASQESPAVEVNRSASVPPAPLFVPADVPQIPTKRSNSAPQKEVSLQDAMNGLKKVEAAKTGETLTLQQQLLNAKTGLRKNSNSDQKERPKSQHDKNKEEALQIRARMMARNKGGVKKENKSEVSPNLKVVKFTKDDEALANNAVPKVVEAPEAAPVKMAVSGATLERPETRPVVSGESLVSRPVVSGAMISRPEVVEAPVEAPEAAPVKMAVSGATLERPEVVGVPVAPDFDEFMGRVNAGKAKASAVETNVEVEVPANADVNVELVSNDADPNVPKAPAFLPPVAPPVPKLGVPKEVKQVPAKKASANSGNVSQSSDGPSMEEQLKRVRLKKVDKKADEVKEPIKRSNSVDSALSRALADRRRNLYLYEDEDEDENENENENEKAVVEELSEEDRVKFNNANGDAPENEIIAYKKLTEDFVKKVEKEGSSPEEDPGYLKFNLDVVKGILVNNLTAYEGEDFDDREDVIRTAMGVNENGDAASGVDLKQLAKDINKSNLTGLLAKAARETKDKELAEKFRDFRKELLEFIEKNSSSRSRSVPKSLNGPQLSKEEEMLAARKRLEEKRKKNEENMKNEENKTNNIRTIDVNKEIKKDEEKKDEEKKVDKPQQKNFLQNALGQAIQNRRLYLANRDTDVEDNDDDDDWD